MAERIALERDLALAELTGARLHVDAITTQGALTALRRARDAGLAVTAGTSIHHLSLNEIDVGAYRTFFRFDFFNTNKVVFFYAVLFSAGF